MFTIQYNISKWHEVIHNHNSEMLLTWRAVLSMLMMMMTIIIMIIIITTTRFSRPAVSVYCRQRTGQHHAGNDIYRQQLLQLIALQFLERCVDLLVGLWLVVALNTHTKTATNETLFLQNFCRVIRSPFPITIWWLIVVLWHVHDFCHK